MDDTMSNQPAAPATKRTRIRIPDKCERLTRAIGIIGQALGREFDASAIEAAMELDDTGFESLRRQLFDGIDAALRGSPSWTPPTIRSWKERLDSMIEDFERWQLSHGLYHQWPADAMTRLRAKLDELGDDKVAGLRPCFAMSIGVTLRSGSTILIDRNGRETLG